MTDEVATISLAPQPVAPVEAAPAQQAAPATEPVSVPAAATGPGDNEMRVEPQPDAEEEKKQTQTQPLTNQNTYLSQGVTEASKPSTVTKAPEKIHEK